MNKNKLLALTALAGGILAAPTMARAQAQPPVAQPAATQPAANPPSTPSPLPAPGEPIIPDSQFEAQVPPLDPALTSPLEPLDQVSPRPVAPGVINPAQPNPSAIAPGTPAPPPTVPFPPEPGPVEDAPLGDPELAQPLPPLSTFQVTPLTPEQQRAAANEAQPSPVRYRLVTTGLTEIDLDTRFRGLSALAEARGEAVNGSMIESRTRQDVELAVRVLNSEGYYDATATSAITPAADADGRLTVTINTVPGARYLFGQISVAGAIGEPAAIARESLLRGIQPEAPIVAAQVEAAEAGVLLTLPQRGYPFAQLGAPGLNGDPTRINIRDILLDGDTHHGDYILLLDSGNKATFRNIVTTEGGVFPVDHVRLLSRFRNGQTYDRRLQDDLREAMVTTRLFRSVSAEPVATGEFAPDGSEYVDIRVDQVAGPSRSLDGSIGYSTGQGLRLEAAWEDRNFFSPEGALRGAAVLGTNEQSLIGRLRFNNWGQRDRALLFQAEIGRRDYAAFSGYTARLFGQVSRESTPIWQKQWTYAYGAELLATNESQVGAPNLSLGDSYFIGGVFGQVGYDRSNSLLDPTSGFRVQLRLNPEASLRGDASFYLRSQLDASYYQPFGESFTLAARARLGSITGIARDDLAPSRRFYAGGGGSVRGFSFQRLGPRVFAVNPAFDPNEDDPEEISPVISLPVGGRGLTELALEGRYRFGNYGIVAFVDGGSVTTSEYPGFDDFRVGVGVGGRLYTNFGPIRVDIATPLGRREGESLINLYISIGQAF